MAARLPLFWKILLLAVGVSVVPLALAMVVSLETATDTAERLVRDNLLEISGNAARRVGYTLVSIESDLEVLARLPRSSEAFRTFSLSQRRELYSGPPEDRRMEPVPKYREVALLEPDGKPVVVVIDNQIRAPLPGSANYRERWCEEVDFVGSAAAQPGQVIVSGLVGCPFSERQYDPAEGRLGKHFDGGFRVSMAITDDRGRVSGVATLLLSQLHLDWAVRASCPKGREDCPVGMMSDAAGDLAAHPEPGLVGSPTGAAFQGVLNRILAGEPATARLKDAGTGDRVVAGSPVRVAFGSERRERAAGAVLVSYPLEEILAASAPLRRRLWLLLGATLLLALVGSALVARNLSRPILNLARAAADLARGRKVSTDSDRGDEIGDLARAFEGMAEDLEIHREAVLRTERLAAIGRFVSGMVHETKNVAAGLGGFLRVLERRLDPADHDRIISPMREALGQLDELARRMRELSATPRFEKTDLARVIEHAADLVRIQAEGKGVQLEACVPEGLELSRADGGLLGHVFLNLLFNGLDATARGGSLRLAANIQAEEICVAIRDDGPGFPPDTPAQRFLDPFFTTKAGGTGLGLYISNTIVERHGGRLHLANQADGGALVTVTLPVETDPEMLPAGTDEPF